MAWASKVRRARGEGKAAATLHLAAFALLIDGMLAKTRSGCSSPWPAPPAGACWPSTAARRSAPPGSSSPPSAPTSSPTASTAASSPTGSSGSTTAAPRRPSGWPTAATSCRPPAGCCSATTSPPSPAPGRWSGRCSPPSSATCPARSGSSSASCSAGAVQDFVILFASMRRDGKSLGQMAQGGDRPGHRHARDGRGARDHGHPARGAGAGRGERAQGQPVGRVHHRSAPSRSRC